MAEKLCNLRKRGGGSSLSETVLWTNPNSSSNFAASTVNLSQNMDNFDYLEFRYNQSKNISSNNKVRIAVSEFQKMDNSITTIPFFAIGYRSASTSRICRMVMYSSNTSVYFSTASYWNGTGAADQYVIPTEIIGIK